MQIVINIRFEERRKVIRNGDDWLRQYVQAIVLNHIALTNMHEMPSEMWDEISLWKWMSYPTYIYDMIIPTMAHMSIQ